MFGLKTGAAVVCAGLMTVGCGGGGDDVTADAPASSEAAPPVESAPPAQMLGGGTLTPVHQIEPSEWDEVLAVNLTANWRLIRALAPLLRRSNAGRATTGSAPSVWNARPATA